MQVQRTRDKKKPIRRKYRFIKGQSSSAPRKREKTAVAAPAPARNSIKKVSAAKKTARKRTVDRETSRAPRTAFLDAPGWDDLKIERNDRVRKNNRESQILSALSTVRISLGILVVAALFTLYVGHVQATKNQLNELYQVRKNNFALNLKYNQLQGEYDTATGPAVIYERAAALGLKEQKLSGPPVYLDQTRR